MAPPTPTQLVWRGRIEAVLRLASPALDLLLATGDRLSRLVDRDEPVASLPVPAQRRVGSGAPVSGRD